MNKWASLLLILSLLLLGCSPSPQQDQEQLRSVATTFAKDILNFKDRTSDTDIKGLEHATKRAQTIVKEKFGDYDKLVENYRGDRRLPEVAKVRIHEVYAYQSPNRKVSGYVVNLRVFYNTRNRNHGPSTLGLLLVKRYNEWAVADVSLDFLPKDLMTQSSR